MLNGYCRLNLHAWPVLSVSLFASDLLAVGLLVELLLLILSFLYEPSAAAAVTEARRPRQKKKRLFISLRHEKARSFV